jgi:hypothetical protein
MPKHIDLTEDSDARRDHVASVGGDNERIMDKREVLKPRTLRLLQQMLANEWGALSPAELAYRNDDLEESTIRDHLSELEGRKRPFVEKLVVDSDDRKQNLPWTYYAVTEYAIELMQEVGVYDGVTVLYQMYERMERNDRIREIEAFENRPTPDWI